MFAIDQLDAMREPMMNMFGVAVMESIATKISSVNTMKNGLLDTRAFRVTQQMMSKARTRNAMPQTCRMRFR
ncbi:hypothetical protein NO361_27435 [Burkholderia cenocepacia]|nr:MULTISPECIES: hypothetical protein [Burkholderia cepacia complex]KVW86814.1 hypothetical protein WL00_16325 [Burkholderia cepacia]KVX60907.1 hypothetical protein WL07_37685 [Burkholderia cepacia]MDR5645722.1 hypothetical protein [Burkholderia cenocepacia]